VTGLFFGDSSQFFAECIGVVVNFAYVGGMTAVALFIIGKLVGNRVSVEDELAGLDVPEMGVLAFPDDARAHPISDAPPSVPVIGMPVARRTAG